MRVARVPFPASIMRSIHHRTITTLIVKHRLLGRVVMYTISPTTMPGDAIFRIVLDFYDA